MIKLYNFKISSELMDRAKECAKQEDRSLTAFVKHLIKKHLKEAKNVQ